MVLDPFPGARLNRLLRTIQRFQEPQMSAGNLVDCFLQPRGRPDRRNLSWTCAGLRSGVGRLRRDRVIVVVGDIGTGEEPQRDRKNPSMVKTARSLVRSDLLYVFSQQL